MRFQSIRKKLFKSILIFSTIGGFFLISSSVFGAKARIYPQTKFVVLSDLHFFDPDLGASGVAFERYLEKDRKLLALSRELLETALQEIAALKVDFVIISGDLTKDGERHNHEFLAEKLRILKQTGKKIFVIPGNHDIWNGHSVRFIEDRTEKIPTISAADFSKIYSEMGYKDALERDSTSLSYLAEPVPGLWLLALDSSKWRENKLDHEPLVGGVIYEDTINWIDSVLQRAEEQGKAVIVTLHHAIMEHYPFNLKYYPEYLVENHEILLDKLSNAGVQMVFTGHFHAQDVTGKTVESSGRTIYDIETGSLVTAPCPFRIIELTSDQKAIIRSRFIEAIPSHPSGFREYADTYVYEGTKKLAEEALKDLWVSEKDQEMLKPQVSRAFTVHLHGDEKIETYSLDYGSAGLWGRFIMFMRKKLLKAWYTDLPPGDNNLTIDLKN